MFVPRFRIRTLMIATAVVAMSLGACTQAVRLWQQWEASQNLKAQKLSREIASLQVQIQALNRDLSSLNVRSSPPLASTAPVLFAPPLAPMESERLFLGTLPDDHRG